MDISGKRISELQDLGKVRVGKNLKSNSEIPRSLLLTFEVKGGVTKPE